MSFRINSEADTEFAESALYYMDESPDAATRFAERVDSAYDEIIEKPYRCPVREHGLREKFVKGFPFSIFYTIDRDEIVIISVAHQSRKPGYWRDRL